MLQGYSSAATGFRIGDPVTLRGSRNSGSSGTIKSIATSSGNLWGGTWTNVAVADYSSSEGDSGGTVTMLSQIYGIHKGRTGTGYSIFSRIDKINGALGTAVR